MIHVDDIEQALDGKMLRQIEAAFGTLLQWPEDDAVCGAGDAGELGRLLDRVTAALETDRNPMPADLVACIMVQSAGGMWLRDDRSYAAGVKAVAARSLKWRLMFAARLDPDNEGQAGFDPYPIV